MAQYTNAVDALAKVRWILPEDRAAMLQQGEKEWAEATKYGPWFSASLGI